MIRFVTINIRFARKLALASNTETQKEILKYYLVDVLPHSLPKSVEIHFDCF